MKSITLLFTTNDSDQVSRSYSNQYLVTICFKTTPCGMISTNISKMFLFPAFCTHPNQIEKQNKFSKIVITTSAKLQPILFFIVSNFLTSKERDEYLIAMQENNIH